MTLAISDPLKKKFEGTVVREFLLAIGSPHKVLRDGLPPEPDVICEHRETGGQVGIEVVSVYYDQNHAKSEWLQARVGKPLSYEIRREDSVENVRLLAESLRRIRAKSRKRYTVNDYLVLVVFMYPQRLYLCDLEERIETLSLPTYHQFDEICLMSQHGEVYRLFPNKTWILR